MILPNEADFVVNEREGEFRIRFSVTGEVTATIRAADLAEARRKAEEMAEDEEFDTYLDEIHRIDIDRVCKSPRMFLVTRGGEKMQVSRLEKGDEPRQPDERGW